MYEYRIRPGALRDLDDIWLFIALDNVDAADEWVERLMNQIQLLAKNPVIGHARYGGRKYGALRFWPYERYVIIYFTTDDAVVVVAVS